ncbi:amino acid adenylation domain-containing protein [Tumidithrix elongata RA019]|uniref:Amino acid adenylation domain-containing protein n=1 Tax=Tumidithrix elongata BACA0141 TaxID=2716417 RepID=A0AAW9PXR0_9CYAN|nr:amino acid adenylation domain-containing protein [Tumidithrix elongata RA019]
MKTSSAVDELSISRAMIAKTDCRESSQFSFPIPEFCQMFEAQAAKSAEAITIAAKGEQLTYQELNARANQLAHYLKAQGVVKETLVALCIDSFVAMLVGMLGILKAGGAYIPLDPAYPHERRASKLRNAKVSLMLPQPNMVYTLLDYGAKVISLDTDWEVIALYHTHNLECVTNSENLAYVIYTSDSTGEPKGVMIEHQSLINHCLALSKAYELNSCDRVLQFSNISFDVAVEEIFPTWLNGGTVVLPPSEIYTSITNFLEIVKQQAITVINLPTAFWHELVNGISSIEQPFSPDLRLVVVGGEKVSKSVYQKWRSLVGAFPRWLNAYGPTETTITATIYDPHSSSTELPPDAEIPIGRAIANLQTYVLDRNLQPSPIGVKGELYIGGVGLSRGYLNRPDITTRRFIPNPFSSDPKDRLYKTGDTVRYLPDGNLEFIGRVDFQIKIRGFRVEPIEIETKLEQYPVVKQAIVLCHDAPSDRSLVAYLAVQQDESLDIEALRSFLQRKLPYYMIPTSFVVLDNLPVTQNGKVDRRALLDLDIATQRNENLISPRDEVEQLLANIWEKLLGRHDIGIHDNFFELGGNSLLSVRLVAEIEKTFNYHLPLSSFFQISTIEEIAQSIREKPSETITADDLPSGLSLQDYRALLSYSAGRPGKHLGKRGLIIETSPTKMRSPQPFVWIGDINVSKKLGLQQPIYTMPVNSWEPLHSPENYISAIATLLVDELLSVQTEGPYAIGAYCYEGLVAMEMTHQLQKQGREVALLALIDKFGPSSLHRLFGKLDWYFCSLTFDWFQLAPLSLREKWQYIQKRLQRRAEFTRNVPQIGIDLVKSQTITLLDEAANRYVLKEYSGRVVLVKSTKSGLKIGSKDIFNSDLSWLFPYYGWEGLLTGKVETYTIPCEHLEVYESPYIEELGYILDNCLQEVK